MLGDGCIANSKLLIRKSNTIKKGYASNCTLGTMDIKDSSRIIAHPPRCSAIPHESIFSLKRHHDAMPIPFSNAKPPLLLWVTVEVPAPYQRLCPKIYL